LAKIAAQCTGRLKAPLVISHASLLPRLSLVSAPTTNAESQIPDEIYENAETIAFVPELQRLSNLWQILGRKPSISAIILEVYCSDEQLENKIASISLFEMILLLKILIQGSQDNSNNDAHAFFLKCPVEYAATATLCNLKC
jgi:hypothetical protein